MGLLLATGMSCTAIVGLPAFVLYRLLVWRVTDPHRRNVLQLGIFGVSVVAAALLFPAVTNGVLQSSVVVKHDVTPANYRSVGPSLPAAASHIRFHSDYADRGTGVYMAFDTKTSTCFYRYSSW